MAVQLPPEVLQLIISHVPRLEHDGDITDDAFAFSASHIITRTLRSCLTVCKATTATSVEQLHLYCLHIDSSWRLRALIRSYDSQTPLPGRSLNATQLRRNASTSMFLKPFTLDTIDEASVVTSISQIFRILDKNLRRLIIDMPLRSYYPGEPRGQNLRMSLRNAFLSLSALEEFVSVRDELYLSTRIPSDYQIEPPVWAKWTKLRRLALYNLDLGEDWSDVIRAMPHLQTIMLTRADFEDGRHLPCHTWPSTLHIGIVNTFRDHSKSHQEGLNRPIPEPFSGSSTIQRHCSTAGWTDRSKPELPALYYICVDGRSLVKQDRSGRQGQPSSISQGRSSNNWAAHDLGGTFNDIQVCQEWVKQRALRGDLWPDSSPT